MSKLFERVLREGPGSGVTMKLIDPEIRGTDLWASEVSLKNYDNSVRFSDAYGDGTMCRIGGIKNLPPEFDDMTYGFTDAEGDYGAGDVSIMIGGGYGHSTEMQPFELGVYLDEEGDRSTTIIVEPIEELKYLWDDLWNPDVDDELEEEMYERHYDDDMDELEESIGGYEIDPKYVDEEATAAVAERERKERGKYNSIFADWEAGKFDKDELGDF